MHTISSIQSAFHFNEYQKFLSYFPPNNPNGLHKYAYEDNIETCKNMKTSHIYSRHESLIPYSFDLNIYIQRTSSHKCLVEIEVLCYSLK